MTAPWTAAQQMQALRIFWESEEGRAYLAVFSAEHNTDADREVFLRDAERRWQFEDDEAKEWWQIVLALVKKSPDRYLALTEPLAQNGIAPETLYDCLPETFTPPALLEIFQQTRNFSAQDASPGVSNTNGWSQADILSRLDQVKAQLKLQSATPEARATWEDFERESGERLASVLRVAEALAQRKATVEEFHFAKLQADTGNLQAVIHYLDYLRLTMGNDTSGSSVWWLKPAPGITRTKSWSHEQIQVQLEKVKLQIFNAAPDAQPLNWWNQFEQENQSQLALVLRLVEELVQRKITINEFHPMLVAANTNNLRAALCYFDYAKLKAEERQQQEAMLTAETERKQKTAARATRRAARVKAANQWLAQLKSGQPRSTFTAADEAMMFSLPRQDLPETSRPHFDQLSRSFSYETVLLNETGEVVSQRAGQAQRLIENLVAGVSLEMVEIPGGKFTMGAPKSEADSQDREYPQHEVEVSPFFIGKFTITQAQWEVVTGWEKIERELEPDPANFDGDDRPVERISWEDAQEFCARLSAKTGRAYRLPTEAEWEYACRAGTTTPFAFGPTIAPEFVNYDGNFPYGKAPKGTYRSETVPVGSLSVANAFGLYDMHGNVWEWCQDWFADDYYQQCEKQGTVIDPTGPDKGQYRALRGGSWNSLGRNCRSANRYWVAPGVINFYFGVRVVVSARTP